MRPNDIARHSEAVFETVIEAHLLQNGYVPIAREGFDRERAIFADTVLAFIRETQSAEWANLESLHGDKTGGQILCDLCKWMGQNGSLGTLRLGLKCYGRTLHAARGACTYSFDARGNPQAHPGAAW
jgi:type I restriction enzyme R subunit